MHNLFEQVLEKKDLSKAGDLFSLEDSVIVDELSEVVKTIQVSSASKECRRVRNIVCRKYRASLSF